MPPEINLWLYLLTILWERMDLIEGGSEFRSLAQYNLRGLYRKCLLESDFLASCRGIPPYCPAIFQKYINYKGGIPLHC